MAWSKNSKSTSIRNNYNRTIFKNKNKNKTYMYNNIFHECAYAYPNIFALFLYLYSFRFIGGTMKFSSYDPSVPRGLSISLTMCV